MTDEEMAKEYAIGRTYPKFETDYIANFVLHEVEGAYLAGLKAGKDMNEVELLKKQNKGLIHLLEGIESALKVISKMLTKKLFYIGFKKMP